MDTFCLSIHPSMDTWVSPPFDYCQSSCCYEHRYTSICLSPCFQFFGGHTWEWNCWLMWLRKLTIFLFFSFFCLTFWPYRTACGILVPQPEIEPAPPAVEARSLNHWTTREVPAIFLQSFTFLVQIKTRPSPLGRIHMSHVSRGLCCWRSVT